jgi:hypothetical protein
MSFMPPSINQLKQEIGISALEESRLNDMLIKEKELKLELKGIQDQIKIQKDILTKILIENDIKEIPLGEDFNMQLIAGGTRLKVMSGKDIQKKYPHLIEQYPDLVTEVKSKDQMRITVKK